MLGTSMTAAFQPPRTAPARSGGSRFFASPPRAPRHRHSRPANHRADRKTAPGIFFVPAPKTRPETVTQVTNTHQESATYVFVFVSGCAVAPNSAATTTFGIFYANHDVAFGIDHSKILIVPSNQNAYANDPRFQNIDANGNRYATIGAGPDQGYASGLWSGVNRPRDLSQPDNNMQQLPIPSQYGNEDAAINVLFTLAQNFNSNPLHGTIDYALFPVGSTTYNSNSFVAGLLNAGGFKMPNPPGGVLPGFGHPVPSFYFQPPH
jgi:hypothetical protein